MCSRQFRTGVKRKAYELFRPDCPWGHRIDRRGNLLEYGLGYYPDYCRSRCNLWWRNFRSRWISIKPFPMIFSFFKPHHGIFSIPTVIHDYYNSEKRIISRLSQLIMGDLEKNPQNIVSELIKKMCKKRTRTFFVRTFKMFLRSGGYPEIYGHTGRSVWFHIPFQFCFVDCFDWVRIRYSPTPIGIRNVRI